MIALSGCGAADLGAGAPAPGMTAVQLINQVGAPCELGSVVLRVGDDVVRLSPAPPRDGRPVRLADVRLEPGDHLIAARVSARCAPPAAQPETVVVSTQRRLRLQEGEGPAILTVGVASRPAAQAPGGGAPGAQLDLGLSARGGLLQPEGGVADAEQRCEALLSGRAALCRAEADFALATERKNAAWALCVRDQLGELRHATDLYDAVRARADREAQALAEARIDEIARRVERCAVLLSPDASSDLFLRTP